MPMQPGQTYWEWLFAMSGPVTRRVPDYSAFNVGGYYRKRGGRTVYCCEADLRDPPRRNRHGWRLVRVEDLGEPQMYEEYEPGRMLCIIPEQWEAV